MSTTFTTTKRTSYGQFSIVVTENSTSISSNTSDVTVQLKYTSADQYYCGVSSFKITDATGVVLGTYSRSYGVVNHISQGTQTLKTFSNLQASHLQDGSGALTIYIKYRIGNTTNYEETFTFNSTKILRASMVSCTNSITITSSSSAGATVTVTPQTTGFYHIVTYTSTASNTSGTLVNKVAINSATNYTLTEANILTVCKSSATDTITITCSTYSDSACTVQVGSSTIASMTVIIDASLAPTLTISAVGVSSTNGEYSISGYLIADGKTKPTITYSTSLQTGATIASIKFTPNVGAPKTTTAASGSGAKMNVLPKGLTADTYYAVQYVITDSRGLSTTGTYTSTSLTGLVYAYAPPIAQITAYRTSSTSASDPAEDPGGARLFYKLTGLITSINGQNAVVNNDTTKTYIQAGSNTAQAMNTAGYNIALALNSSITIKALVTDKIGPSGTVATQLTVGPAVFPIDLYDDSAGNVGVAFGAIAESGKVKTTLQATFNHSSSMITNSSKVMVGNSAAASAQLTGPVPYVYSGGKGSYASLAQDSSDDVKIGFTSSSGGFIAGSNSSGHTGFLTIFGSSSGANNIIPANNSTTTYTNTLPAKTGTFAMTSDLWTNLWTGTLQGGSNQSLDVSAYSRIKIFFVSYSSAGQFEIDLTKQVPTPQVSGQPYAGSGVCPYYASSRVETHVCKASVNTAKTTIYNDWQGYYYGTTYTARNSNASYYIYRIDGIKDL